jgi:hypothetical protein
VGSQENNCKNNFLVARAINWVDCGLVAYATR